MLLMIWFGARFVLVFGRTDGWFDKNPVENNSTVHLTEVQATVTVHRDGSLLSREAAVFRGDVRPGEIRVLEQQIILRGTTHTDTVTVETTGIYGRPVKR